MNDTSGPNTTPTHCAKCAKAFVGPDLVKDTDEGLMHWTCATGMQIVPFDAWLKISKEPANAQP